MGDSVHSSSVQHIQFPLSFDQLKLLARLGATVEPDGYLRLARVNPGGREIELRLCAAGAEASHTTEEACDVPSALPASSREKGILGLWHSDDPEGPWGYVFPRAGEKGFRVDDRDLDEGVRMRVQSIVRGRIGRVSCWVPVTYVLEETSKGPRGRAVKLAP